MADVSMLEKKKPKEAIFKIDQMVLPKGSNGNQVLAPIVQSTSEGECFALGTNLTIFKLGAKMRSFSIGELLNNIEHLRIDGLVEAGEYNRLFCSTSEGLVIFDFSLALLDVVPYQSDKGGGEKIKTLLAFSTDKSLLYWYTGESELLVLDVKRMELHFVKRFLNECI